MSTHTGYRLATEAHITEAMRASARRIGEAAILARRDFSRYAEDYRLAMRASREQHGDDLHEVVKAMALAGASGGQA